MCIISVLPAHLQQLGEAAVLLGPESVIQLPFRSVLYFYNEIIVCVNVSFSAQNKLEGTLWMDVDDARVFKILDLEDIEKTFSAYQRQQVLMLLEFLFPELMRHEIYQQSNFNVPFLFIILMTFAQCI